MSANRNADAIDELDRVATPRTRRLRAGVLRLGEYIGWDAPAVERFSEAITGRPWRQCETRDFLRVIGAFAEAARRLRVASLEAQRSGEPVEAERPG